MLDIYICVGSSCHIKGSYYIIKAFKELIKSNGLGDRVQIKASFCLGHCTRGVSIKIGEEIFGDVTVENAVQKFEEYIKRRF